MQVPEATSETTIEKAIKPHLEENERLQDKNHELEQRLQQVLGEYAVLKQDCEIIKNKARQLLIEKDKEIGKIKAQRGIKDVEESKKGLKDTGSMGDSGASNFQETTEIAGTKTTGNTLPADTQLFQGQGLHLHALDKSFVRNILFKYLEYSSAGEEKEALQLEKVLFTVLEATQENLDSLERQRAKNNGGFLGYFYTQPSQMVAKPININRN